MAYKTRTVKSSKGLSQEKALLTLQKHPEFKPGTKIASIYNQGGVWVAKLLEPKTAADPFGDIEEDVKESPAKLHDDKHEEKESPFEEIEEHENHEDDESKKINELEKKIDLLLDALGIDEKGESPDTLGEASEGLEGLEGPVADAPAAPSKGKGGPKSDPLPPGSGAKLKPGEIPNKPGQVPVGAPAFSSVKQATDGASGMPASPSAAGPVGAPANPVASSCPNCGGTAGNCTCSNKAGTPNVPGASSPSASGPIVASFTASKSDPMRGTSIRMAKAQLENKFKGFRVARIKREDGVIHAHMKRADFLADSSASFLKKADREQAADYTKRFKRQLRDHLFNTGEQFGQSYQHDPSLDYSEILGRGPEYGVGGRYNDPMTVTKGYRDYLSGDETNKAMDEFFNNWRKEQHDPMLAQRRDSYYGVGDNEYEDIMNEVRQQGASGPWASGFNSGHFTPENLEKMRQPDPEPAPETAQQAPAQGQAQGQGLWDKAKGLFQGQPQQPAAQSTGVAPQWQPDRNEIF